MPVKPPRFPAYEQTLARWRNAGGSDDFCPLLFQWLLALKPHLLDERGEDRPHRTIEFGAGIASLALMASRTVHTAVSHDPGVTLRLLHWPGGQAIRLVTAEFSESWFDWEPRYGEHWDTILLTRHPVDIERVAPLLDVGGTVVVTETQRPERQALSDALAERLGLQRRTGRMGDWTHDILSAPREPLGDGPGTELLDILKEMPGMRSCQLCYTLARRMNLWGPAECRNRLDCIVDDMLPRALHWWHAQENWMRAEAFFKGQQPLWVAARGAMSLAAGAATGATAQQQLTSILRIAVRTHVLTSIKTCERKRR